MAVCCPGLDDKYKVGTLTGYYHIPKPKQKETFPPTPISGHFHLDGEGNIASAKIHNGYELLKLAGKLQKEERVLVMKDDEHEIRLGFEANPDHWRGFYIRKGAKGEVITCRLECAIALGKT
jgi:hypothetical protein